MEGINSNELMKIFITEAVFILITVAFAILEVWNAFAAMALLCILLPLWIIAIVSVIHFLTYIKHSPLTEDKRNDQET